MSTDSLTRRDDHVLTSYSIRLATHLYAEHLLDREHYMDWLVSSLESCPQAKLPMWLLIIQIYWRELEKFRIFGRRLVAALLDQHTKVWACLIALIYTSETTNL